MSRSAHVHLELAVGRLVRDEGGRAVGRIHDVQGREEDGEMRIVEYHLRPASRWLAVIHLLGRFVGVHPHDPVRIGWEKIDISDPRRPRYRGTYVKR